jgi:hypothetical protein
MMGAVRIVDLVSSDDDRTYEPAARMAAAIVEISRKNGDCLPQDLNQKGFSPDAVAAHWHMAKSLAAVELKLMRHRQMMPGRDNG